MKLLQIGARRNPEGAVHVLWRRRSPPGWPGTNARELACVLDVRAERVRQIEQAALDRLRATVAGGDVHEHLTNPRCEPAR
jgi:sigma-70-like protein